MSYEVSIEIDTESDMVVVRCPELPGCISQGRTVEEAVVNLREAAQGYIESLAKHGEEVE